MFYINVLFSDDCLTYFVDHQILSFFSFFFWVLFLLFIVLISDFVCCGIRSEPYDNTLFNEWVVTGKAPGFDASLRLYKALKKLGFTIILLTGRDESQRSITEQNLRDAGYYGWNRLLLR